MPVAILMDTAETVGGLLLQISWKRLYFHEDTVEIIGCGFQDVSQIPIRILDRKPKPSDMDQKACFELVLWKREVKSSDNYKDMMTSDKKLPILTYCNTPQ